jgi:predicted XRE-type DNA-binding protein
MSQGTFNIEKAMARWGKVMENNNIKEDRREWVAEYAENHNKAFNEGLITESGVAYNNKGMGMGMGPVISPGNPGAPGIPGTAGSGDLGTSLIKTAFKIANGVIGLNLVATKTTANPVIDLPFMDITYGTGDGNSTDYDNPQVFMVRGGEAFSDFLRAEMAANFVFERVGGLTSRMFVKFSADGLGTAYSHVDETVANGSKAGILEFLGFSRIEGLPMFRAFRQSNAVGASNFGFDADKNTFGATDVIKTVLASAKAVTSAGTAGPAIAATRIELVSTLEDHIPGFVSNWNQGPMDRGQDDNNYPNVLGAALTVRRVTVGSIEISSFIKKNQMEDIKAATGIDVVQKMRESLTNELIQKISKDIVSKLFEMGEKNRLTTRSVGGTISGKPAKLFDFDVDNYLSTNAPGGETSHAVARKLIARLRKASNFIGVDGRVGPAHYLVMNFALATAIMDIAGYSLNPADIKPANVSSKQVYEYGTVGGMTVYIDPYMPETDNRILLGRKNTADEPGIVFVPYLLAQAVEMISEATATPRLLIRSRYAVAELGWYPHKQYMVCYVKDTNGILC